MAVSYVSKTFKSSPYVLPLDLNLFQGVMAIKEKQFEQGHEKIQNEVDQMGMLDVLKDSDREYLNTKIGNMVNTVNGMGGVNYSDPAILSQIESLGGDIYGDDKVINAISSTKSIRNLVKSYNDYKTNPKLTKLYSPVNEAYDMRNVNAYLSDGQVGSSYHGPAQATPYSPYRDNLLKAFEKVKADYVETIDQNGLYILKTGERNVTPQRLMSMASDLLLPEEQSQMKRDSWYVYNVQSPTPPEAMIKKGMEQYYSKLAEQEQIVKYYEDQAAAAVADPQTRQKLSALARDAKESLSDLKAQESKLAQNSVNAYKSDPEEYGYQVYRQDFLRGLANRFSYKETTRSVQFDQAKMFNARMEQAQAFHNDSMDIEREKLDIQHEKNAIDAYGTVYKRIDPLTGKTEYLPANGAQGGLLSSNLNTQDPNSLKVDEHSLVNLNTELTMQKDQMDMDFLDQVLSKYPNLTEYRNTNSGTGNTRVLRGQEILENVNGRPGFQIEDLAGVEGKRAQLIQAKIAPKDIDFLKNLYQNYQNILSGKGALSPDLPAGFPELVENKRMIDLRIEANNSKINSINEEVLKQAKLTDKEIALYTDYVRNPGKYNARMHVSAGAPDPISQITSLFINNKIDKLSKEVNNSQLAKILDKLENSGLDIGKMKQDRYSTLATRDVFRSQTFDKTPESLKSYVKSELSRGIGSPVNGSSKVDFDELTDVKAISKGFGQDGAPYLQVELTSGSGDSKSASMYTFPLDAQNAKTLGLESDPYDHLNYTVNIKGRAERLPVYATNNLAVEVDIVRKSSRNLNDPSSYAQARLYHVDRYGNPTGDYDMVDLPQTDGRTPSEAYALAKQLILQAGKNPVHPMTLEEFKEALYKANKNK